MSSSIDRYALNKELILRTLAASMGERVRSDEIMKDHTTMRVGGPADIFADAASADEVALAVRLARENGFPYYVMGNGSNVIVRDGGFRGLIIRLGSAFSRCEAREDNTVWAQCGAALGAVARVASENSLAGMEFASGIPGSVGGAVAMNAGAYGGEMKDIISRVRVLTDEGEEIYDVKKLDPGYRTSSVLRNGYTVLEATFALFNDDRAKIMARMSQLNRQRREKQPLEYPSSGSTFKRPEGHYAGALIEGAGLKGVSVGGARVSEKHAGFVINSGKACAKDVTDLIALIQERVFDRYGVKLETEVRIIGDELA